MSTQKLPPLVGILMGSASDWSTVEHAAATFDALEIGYEAQVMSAHRTPDEVHAYATSAESRGLQVLICAAGGAAHLAGVVAANTLLPVLGIPIKAWSLDGLDSLLSTVQMPAGVPVGTLAIGKAGAINSALFAVAILARSDESIRARYEAWRKRQAEMVRNTVLPPRS